MSDGFIVGSAISGSQINNSTSKQSYSFGKGSRFGNQSSSLASSNGLMYNLPSVKMTRATSLGVGDRMNLAGNKNRTQPPFYNIPSDFDSKKSHGFSFGISREYTKVLISLLLSLIGLFRRSS